jgi:hypothetical protein
MNATPEQLQKIKSVQFHILAAAYDGDKGNIERAQHLLEFFKKKGIENSFSDVRLTPTALHDWHHANLYAEKNTAEALANLFKTMSQTHKAVLVKKV